MQNIIWWYPDDGDEFHFVGDGPGDPVKTPWSRRLEVKADQGPINLTVIGDSNSDSGMATCRILANGKVVDEQTDNVPRCMVTVQRAFPAKTGRP